MKPATPRIYLHPGLVQSVNDDDTHHVTAVELARLYHVDIRACHIVHPDKGTRTTTGLDNEIHLYPKPSGNYKPLESILADRAAWGTK